MRGKGGGKPGLVQTETCLFFSIQLEGDESVTGAAPRPWLCPKGKCHGKKDIKQFTFITHCLIVGVRLAAGDMKLAGYKLLKSKISFKSEWKCVKKEMQLNFQLCLNFYCLAYYPLFGSIFWLAETFCCHKFYALPYKCLQKN